MFFAANRSKRSLALDFKDVRGREALLRLVDRADVFVQSMRAGAAERHGLDGETLRARNPRSSTCSIGAFGPDGPLAGEPGYDPLMQAFAGIISITGEPDRPGVRVGASLIDIGTGVWAALGIVAALLERGHDGPRARGRASRCSTRRSRSSATSSRPRSSRGVAAGPSRDGVPADRAVRGVRDGGRRADDRGGERPPLRLFCRRIGLPELADDPRFATNPDRLAHRDELLPPIRTRLAEHSSMHWLKALEGVPVAPVQDLVQVGEHPQTRAGGMLQASAGVEAVAAPLRVDGERLQHPRRRRASASTRPACSRSSATTTRRSRRSCAKA